MANKIKGITAKIGGDTAKLLKEEGGNKSVINMQTQLNDVQNSYLYCITQSDEDHLLCSSTAVANSNSKSKPRFFSHHVLL